LKLNINNFKGLRQDIDYPELPKSYCHVLTNIDIDDPLGKMRVRDGSQKKYDNTFTDLISAYEYRFDKSGETKLIFNDDGTLKNYTDGASLASLSLPTGATLEEDFRNQYFGYKDHVLITTGNGSTNYVLWYGYVDRVNDENTGLFGNVKENTGYVFVKSQLVCPNGVFSDVYNTCKIGDFYYFSFENSKYIEKRDLDFHLIERRVVHSNDATYVAKDNNRVALCTDGTYLYVAYQDDDSVKDMAVEKINPDGWKQEAEYTPSSAVVNREPYGICTDGTHVYVLCRGDDGDPDYIIYQLLCTDMSHVADDDTDLDDDGLDICCDDTASTGYFYILRSGSGAGGNDEICKRKKSDLTEDSSDDTYENLEHCMYNTVNNHIRITSLTSGGRIYGYTEALATLAAYTTVDNPKAFVLQGGTTWMAISSKYGTLEDFTDTDTDYPGLAGINLVSQEAGSQVIGTYFYKFSIVDLDGQEYTLSDPIVAMHTVDDRKSNLRIIVHTDYLNDLYRVQYINIYRAYSSTVDAELPSTDYKFLEQININSIKWGDDETEQELFYYDYTDDVLESEISSTTFLESSGIGDAVKPRYANYKFMAWIENQLHAANFNYDGENHRNRIIMSPPDQPDNIALYDYYDFDVGDGDVIKGIGEIYGRSIVFKNRKFGIFYRGSYQGTFIPGLCSDAAFVKRGDDIYFMSDQGLHFFDGKECVNIKNAVTTIFNAATSYDNASVFYVDKLERIIFSIRNDRALVYNARYKIWMHYSLAMAFRGFFKNYANEYIAWNQTGFYEVFNGDAKDTKAFDGTAGTPITITYESPLLRFTNGEGDFAILVSHRHRLYHGGDSVTFTLYRYEADASGKTSFATKLLAIPGGTEAAVKTYFFDKILGESFSFKIDGGIASGFEYHGMTIDYLSGGNWYE